MFVNECLFDSDVHLGLPPSMIGGHVLLVGFPTTRPCRMWGGHNLHKCSERRSGELAGVRQGWVKETGVSFCVLVYNGRGTVHTSWRRAVLADRTALLPRKDESLLVVT